MNNSGWGKGTDYEWLDIKITILKSFEKLKAQRLQRENNDDGQRDEVKVQRDKIFERIEQIIIPR